VCVSRLELSTFPRFQAKALSMRTCIVRLPLLLSLVLLAQCNISPEGVAPPWSPLQHRFRGHFFFFVVLPLHWRQQQGQRGCKPIARMWSNCECVSKSKDIDVIRTPGVKYLEENGKKEGVVTTETGLQYKV